MSISTSDSGLEDILVALRYSVCAEVVRMRWVLLALDKDTVDDNFLLCDIILITTEFILILVHYHRLIKSTSLLEIA